MALIKKDFGELLVDNGLITAEELKLVQQERLRTGEPISLILSRLGLANETHLQNALEMQFGVKYISLAKSQPELGALELLPETLMRQHQIVPVSSEGNCLMVAMVNPNNLLALDDIKYRLKGMQIKTMVCTEDDFQHFMENIYASRQDLLQEESYEEADQTFIEAEVDLSTLDLISSAEDHINDLDLAKQTVISPHDRSSIP